MGGTHRGVSEVKQQHSDNESLHTCTRSPHCSSVALCLLCHSVPQEKFEAAVEEYKTAQDKLARVEGGHTGHRRRWAAGHSPRCCWDR